MGAIEPLNFGPILPLFHMLATTTTLSPSPSTFEKSFKYLFVGRVLKSLSGLPG
jgi:hypothetical protein